MLKTRRFMNGRLKLYEILTWRGPNRDRNFARHAVRGLIEEAVMLDVAFVALGLALIGLMAIYAAGLRQL